jgi:uncharacterized protein (DUF58 family)
MIKLDIKSKRKLFLNTAGEHSSIFNGDGLDFKEIREYDTGDDIRHVNWKVTARSGTPSVNIFNEDKQINIVLVYLNSGSIQFGTNRSKQDTMVDILRLLSNTAIKKNDLLTTVFFNETEQKYYKPTRKHNIIELISKSAYDLENIGHGIDYKALEFYLLKKIKSKSLIFVIGDFLELPSFKMLSKKHEIYCAVVRDKLEEDLKLTGEFNFVDTVSMDEDKIYLDDSSCEKYNKLMKEYNQTLYSYFSKHKIRNQTIYTSDDVIKQLYKLLKV